MTITRTPVLGLMLGLFASIAHGQGITTAGIRGIVRSEDSTLVDRARVTIVHGATGFRIETETRNGRFLAQGLEPGGPYSVSIRHIGFRQELRKDILLRLGEMVDMSFALNAIPAGLDTLFVIAPSPTGGRNAAGTAAIISGGMLRLPAFDRDLYDFVRLVPQVSTKIGLANAAFSAAGVGFRYNNFLINGVSERTLSGGVSSAFGGAKSAPLDAVKEYQVLTAPYDVRYGGFTGGLVNTVTRSGENSLNGSFFIHGRNDRLRRNSEDGSSYDRLQYGFSLGGPIIRDRLHFFISPELQYFTYPAAGPYVGQPSNAERQVPVTSEVLGRFDDIMQRYGLVAGSAGRVYVGNPLTNVYARADLGIPEWSSRLVLWGNYGGSDDITFSRAERETFSLSTYRSVRLAIARTIALQLHSALPRAGGGHNELLVSHRSDDFRGAADVRQPIVRVIVPGVSGGHVTLNSGTHENAQGTGSEFFQTDVRNHLTVPLGTSHTLSGGIELERFRVRRMSRGSYGTWTFASLDDFERGIADSYEATVDFGSGRTPISGAQYGAYAADQWRAGGRMVITGGIRVELLDIDGSAPYNRDVDSIFGRRTDAMPRRRVEISPRIGFTWDADRIGRHRIRGGVGAFTGRYPLAWAHTALSSYGIGLGIVRCFATPTGVNEPPAFNPDHRTRPESCEGGGPTLPNQRGDVDLLDRNLRMTRTVKASLAYDVRLPGDMLLTTEALLTRMLSDFVFVNINLQEPSGLDSRGRVMYGSIGVSGAAAPRLRSNFPEVIDLRNTSRNHSQQLAVKLEREFTRNAGGLVSYTYTRARDAQTPIRVNTRGTVTWSSARVMSGNHDDLTPTVSSNDVPHRVVAAGTLGFPWRRARTEFSFYYVGESGRPFTWIASGTQRRGDLNADGVLNDPIYVPRDSFDPAEIEFAGDEGAISLQRSGFEHLIEDMPCLHRQRGRILERNSCREPWSNTTVASLRQRVPVKRRTLEAHLDVFNVLNLLRNDWGLRREAEPALLEHIGQTTSNPSRPVFRFDSSAPRWTTLPVESAFQLQLGLRYAL